VCLCVCVLERCIRKRKGEVRSLERAYCLSLSLTQAHTHTHTRTQTHPPGPVTDTQGAGGVGCIRTFAVGCGGIFASIFGMNLPSGLETSPLAFYGMATSVLAVVVSVFAIFLRRMRRLVRARRPLP
jgi:hypothetical protein